MRRVNSSRLDRNSDAIASNEEVWASMRSVNLKTRVGEIAEEIKFKEPGIKTRSLKLLQKVTVGVVEVLEGQVQHISGRVITWGIDQ